MNVRDWTAVTDVDGAIKIQDFDGNTIATVASMKVASVIIQLVELLNEAQPSLLDQLEASANT